MEPIQCPACLTALEIVRVQFTSTVYNRPDSGVVDTNNPAPVEAAVDGVPSARQSASSKTYSNTVKQENEDVSRLLREFMAARPWADGLTSAVLHSQFQDWFTGVYGSPRQVTKNRLSKCLVEGCGGEYQTTSDGRLYFMPADLRAAVVPGLNPEDVPVPHPAVSAPEYDAPAAAPAPSPVFVDLPEEGEALSRGGEISIGVDGTVSEPEPAEPAASPVVDEAWMESVVLDEPAEVFSGAAPAPVPAETWMVRLMNTGGDTADEKVVGVVAGSYAEAKGAAEQMNPGWTGFQNVTLAPSGPSPVASKVPTPDEQMAEDEAYMRDLAAADAAREAAAAQAVIDDASAETDEDRDAREFAEWKAARAAAATALPADMPAEALLADLPAPARLVELPTAVDDGVDSGPAPVAVLPAEVPGSDSVARVLSHLGEGWYAVAASSEESERPFAELDRLFAARLPSEFVPAGSAGASVLNHGGRVWIVGEAATATAAAPASVAVTHKEAPVAHNEPVVAAEPAPAPLMEGAVPGVGKFRTVRVSREVANGPASEHASVFDGKLPADWRRAPNARVESVEVDGARYLRGMVVPAKDDAGDGAAAPVPAVVPEASPALSGAPAAGIEGKVRVTESEAEQGQLALRATFDRGIAARGLARVIGRPVESVSANGEWSLVASCVPSDNEVAAWVDSIAPAATPAPARVLPAALNERAADRPLVPAVPASAPAPVAVVPAAGGDPATDALAAYRAAAAALSFGDDGTDEGDWG